MSVPKLIYVALRLLLGATFLLSAYTKTIDFNSFELRLLDLQLIGWGMVPHLATALIVAEFAIGFYFICAFIQSKEYNKLTAAFLIVFSLYLARLWAIEGNDVNCGCMGETIPFTPLQALVKNALSLGILYLIHLFERKFPYLRAASSFQHVLLLLLGLSTAALNVPNFLNPVPAALQNPSFFDHTLLQKSSTLSEGNFNFERQEPYLIAFLSMSCGHCRIAAERLSSMQRLNQKLPIFIVLNGDSSALHDYRAEQKIESIPFTLLEAAPFIQLAGTSVPVLFIVQNDSVRYDLNLYQLNGKQLEGLLQ